MWQRLVQKFRMRERSKAWESRTTSYRREAARSPQGSRGPCCSWGASTGEGRVEVILAP